MSARISAREFVDVLCKTARHDICWTVRWRKKRRQDAAKKTGKNDLQPDSMDFASWNPRLPFFAQTAVCHDAYVRINIIAPDKNIIAPDK